jgi:3-carboxy-cis,cis-muconate cycloisomerase
VTASPFDHPILSGLFGDDEIADHLSPDEEVRQYYLFESALAIAEAAEGIIPQAAAEQLTMSIDHADIPVLREGTARDGVPAVAFVRKLKERVGPEHAQHIHVGATSQDLIDTALVLRLRPILTVLERRIDALIAALEHLAARDGANPLMGVTRMQEALPITAGARVETWSLPLARHKTRLGELRPRLLVLQFGGAVGTLDALGAKGRAVAERMAQMLGLSVPPRSWHTQRDNLAEFASWLSLVSGTLGKIGEDIALMALTGDIELSGGGGSSAMPHKQNPVRAEVLVSLARYAAILSGGMHQAQVHELERSGAAWTLEWLILPQLVMTTGAGLRIALELSGGIESIGGDRDG